MQREPFAMIPVSVAEKLFKCSGLAVKLYILLLVTMDFRRRECWLSRPTMAERIGCSRTSVIRVLGELVDAELITRGRPILLTDGPEAVHGQTGTGSSVSPEQPIRTTHGPDGGPSTDRERSTDGPEAVHPRHPIQRDRKIHTDRNGDRRGVSTGSDEGRGDIVDEDGVVWAVVRGKETSKELETILPPQPTKPAEQDPPSPPALAPQEMDSAQTHAVSSSGAFASGKPPSSRPAPRSTDPGGEEQAPPAPLVAPRSVREVAARRDAVTRKQRKPDLRGKTIRTTTLEPERSDDRPSQLTPESEPENAPEAEGPTELLLGLYHELVEPYTILRHVRRCDVMVHTESLIDGHWARYDRDEFLFLEAFRVWRAAERMWRNNGITFQKLWSSTRDLSGSWFDKLVRDPSLSERWWTDPYWTDPDTDCPRPTLSSILVGNGAPPGWRYGISVDMPCQNGEAETYCDALRDRGQHVLRPILDDLDRLRQRAAEKAVPEDQVISYLLQKWEHNQAHGKLLGPIVRETP
jgi:hypothetical protein